MPSVRVDPATRFVRSLPGEFFLLREAAEAVGVSQFTLRKLISDGTPGCIPSKYAMFGKTKIYLYTREDIESIRKYVENKNMVYDHDGPARRAPGRPAIFTKSERKQRSRLYSKAWYWRNRASILMEKGDETEAQKALDRAAEVERQLKEKHEHAS